jgi:hypothetical protein
VDCTQSGVDTGACTYDPLSPQLDASDVHYSNADQGFIGPDGHAYVWIWLPQENLFLVVDAGGACATYQRALEYNQCSLFGP